MGNPNLLPYETIVRALQPCLSSALMNRKYKKSLSFLKKRIYNKAQIKWE